jgi:hypothetical protein
MIPFTEMHQGGTSMIHLKCKWPVITAVIALLGMHGTLLMGSQAQGASPEEVPFCKLISSPFTFDRIVVKTRAILVQDHRGSVDYCEPFLYSEDCLSNGALLASGYARSKPLDAIMAIQDKGRSRARVTITGEFQAPRGIGYGHLGWAQFQFNILSLDKVERVDSKVPYPESQNADEITDEIKRIDYRVALFLAGCPSARDEALAIVADDYLAYIAPLNTLNKRELESKGSLLDGSQIWKHTIKALRIYNGVAVVSGSVEACKSPENCSPSDYQNVYVLHNKKWSAVASFLISSRR